MTLSLSLSLSLTEKESKMKIIQNINGLPSHIYWLSWYLYFITMGAICIGVTLILTMLVSSVFGRSTPLGAPFLNNKILVIMIYIVFLIICNLFYQHIVVHRSRVSHDCMSLSHGCPSVS